MLIARQKTTAMLLKMIREDEVNATKRTVQKAAGTKLTQEERIADLIFQLCDQNGYQWSQPGACDIFNDSRGEKSPAHQLLAMGEAAIPQLIEVIDDQRFTRSIGYHRDFYFSHHVLRVGDCAAKIISRISGKNFYHRKSTNGAMTKDGKASETKIAVQKWWAGYQKKGRKQMLIDGTAQGDRDSIRQLAQLEKDFPDAVLEPLIDGASKTDQPYIFIDFVRRLGKMSDGRSLAFLRSQFESRANLQERIALAVQLIIRGEKDVVPEIVEEFENLVKLYNANPKDNSNDRAESILSFLVSTGDSKSIAVIEQNFAKLPVNERLEAVESVLNYGQPFLTVYVIPDEFRHADGQAFSLAIKRFLHHALADTQRRVGMSMGRNKHNFQDPRICDFAAYALAQRWPLKYKYPVKATLEERESNQLELLNAWKARQ